MITGIARKRQAGNVLFLILIAVALFAALSYAVTASSRSGSDANRETNVINAAALTQYPNQLRTAVLRLSMQGTDPTLLHFNKPDEMTGSGYTAFVATRGVFSASGGAAAYVPVSGKLTASGSDLEWDFSMDFMVPLVGTDTANGAGNDLIAFADGVSQSACSRVNQDLGYGTAIPVQTAAITLADNRTATTTTPAVPATTGDVLDDGANGFDSKAFGCFQNGTGGNYVFYYVLAER